MMVFVDGENLTMRYQAMVTIGWEPRHDMIHRRNALLWHPGNTQLALTGNHEVLRATYYTSTTGGLDEQNALREQIQGLTFSKNPDDRVINRLTGRVFHRDKNTNRSKGVDIQLAVDVLNHVHFNHVDTVYLLSGDGDYLPLVDEVQRSGKQLYLAAFSDGLSTALKERADEFYCLDHNVFPRGTPVRR
jgi:uncharacterized LabA/DUF88 family protein